MTFVYRGHADSSYPDHMKHRRFPIVTTVVFVVTGVAELLQWTVKSWGGPWSATRTVSADRTGGACSRR